MTLYKFREWPGEHAEKALTIGELYFSNNYSFNDPFDLQLPVIVDGKLPPIEDNLIILFRNEFNKTPNSWELEQLKANWDKMEMKTARNNVRNEITRFTKNLENTLGVLCLSQTFKSTLMWGHYANSHKGFCIGYNKSELKSFIDKTFNNRAQMLEVDYVDKIPRLNLEEVYSNPNYGIESANKRFSTKHTHWKYEEELRIIVANYANKKLVIPQSIISEVILGCNISDKDSGEIMNICNSKLPHIMIYKSVPNKTEFGMTKELIE